MNLFERMRVCHMGWLLGSRMGTENSPLTRID